MSAPKLRQLQRWFWDSIARQPGGCEFVPELVAAIEPVSTLTSAQRLEVYAGAYYLRLREVLSEDFPRTAKLLGEREFSALAGRYLKAHPSTAPSVRYLGRAMADFLAGDESIPPWFADLAALEWARVEAFDAPDQQPLSLAELTQIDPAQWPQLRLIPVRSLTILNAAWPVHRLWAEDLQSLEPAATSIRIWRGADFKVLHAPMDIREAAAMAKLAEGATFAEICQVFEDLDEQEAARQTGALLLRWLEDAIIADAQENVRCASK